MSTATLLFFSIMFIVAGVSAFQISLDAVTQRIRMTLVLLSFGLCGLGSAGFVGVLLVIAMENDL